MYADDLILICPSHHGLQRLLYSCEIFGVEYDVLFNSTKTVCMVVRPERYRKFVFSGLLLNNASLNFVIKYKYLGHIIVDTADDDDDINRQLCQLYAKGNSLIKNFDKCSNHVKSRLFNTFMTNVYCMHLWSRYKRKTWDGFRVAYNNIFRRFFHVRRHIEGVTVSVSDAQATLNVPSVDVIYARLGRSLYNRLLLSNNSYLARLVGTDLFESSDLINKWRVSG